MRNTDEVQIERSYCKAVKIIERLQAEKAALRDENISLKNRPETVYDNPPGYKKFRLPIEPAKKARIDLDIPISKWNIHHFVRYFQVKYEETHSVEHPIRGKRWKAVCIRLSGFRKQHKAVSGNVEYKDFMDWMFEKKFNSRFQASIPLVSHEAMLRQWIIAEEGSTTPASFDDLIESLPTSTQTAEEILQEFK